MLGNLLKIEDPSAIIPLVILTVFSLASVFWLAVLFIQTAKPSLKKLSPKKPITPSWWQYFKQWYRRVVSREAIFHRIEVVSMAIRTSGLLGKGSGKSSRLRRLLEETERLRKENESLSEAYLQARARLASQEQAVTNLKGLQTKDQEELRALASIYSHFKGKTDQIEVLTQDVFGQLEQIYRQHPEVPEFQKVTLRLKDLLKEMKQPSSSHLELDANGKLDTTKPDYKALIEKYRKTG